jgi:hypothetical protein
MTVNSPLTAGQAITRAYRLLGVLEDPWVPSADQMTQGILAANLMQRGWEADGVNLWRLSQVTLTVAAGARSVAITPYVLGVVQALWQVSPAPNTFNRTMGPMAYVDYFNLPNPDAQTSAGPSVYAFDKQDASSTLWLWPKPVAGGTIVATVARAVTDIQTAADVLDIPGEWAECFVYNLADRLMDDQGLAAADPATATRINAHAQGLYQKLLNFDRPTSIYLRPYGGAGRARR